MGKKRQEEDQTTDAAMVAEGGAETEESEEGGVSNGSTLGICGQEAKGAVDVGETNDSDMAAVALAAAKVKEALVTNGGEARVDDVSRGETSMVAAADKEKQINSSGSKGERKKTTEMTAKDGREKVSKGGDAPTTPSSLKKKQISKKKQCNANGSRGKKKKAVTMASGANDDDGDQKSGKSSLTAVTEVNDVPPSNTPSTKRKQNDNNGKGKKKKAVEKSAEDGISKDAAPGTRGEAKAAGDVNETNDMEIAAAAATEAEDAPMSKSGGAEDDIEKGKSSTVVAADAPTTAPSSPRKKRRREKKQTNSSESTGKMKKRTTNTAGATKSPAAAAADVPSSNTPPTKKNQNNKGGSKGKKKRKAEKSIEDSTNLEFTWICTECREAECVIDPSAPLLICDGKCNRPFHPPCANLSSLPPEDEPWFCPDCTQGRHQCVVCKEYGEDGVDVFCCDAKGCGLFFHENCLALYENVEVTLVEEEVPVSVTTADEKLAAAAGVAAPTAASAEGGGSKEEDAAAATTRIVSRPKFRCPAHECWTCSGGCPPQEVAPICLPVGSNNTPSAASITPEKSGAVLDESLPPGRGKKGGGRRGKKRKKGGVQPAMQSLWGTKKERLFRCLECPISYHITCMPPSCRFHELAMLCHEHAYTSKLPYLDAEYSIQAEVEAEADKKIESLKRSLKRKEDSRLQIMSSEEEGGGSTLDDDDEEENSFLPGLVGSAVLFEEDQLANFLVEQKMEQEDSLGPRKRKKRRQYNYCLPVDFKELVHSKPPAYTHVNMNRFDPRNRPKRHPPTGLRCSCKPPTAADEGGNTNPNELLCGDRCLNRLSYIECVGDLSLKSGDKNPYWNCNCGPKCGNRALSQRQFAKCKPAREHGKGWGLITVNGVKKGDLVQEYVGEVIDEKAKEERLKEWSRDHPNDPNFYVMHLEPGWYIDAREVANMARFINHSCDPNCKLVPINVAGYMRVAIVCIKEVPPGGFLSYDYHFDTQHEEKFICRCGAPNCRGSMKGASGKTAEDMVGSEKKSKKQLLSEAKARVLRDKKFLQSVNTSEKDRLYLTGPFVPGSDAEAAEMVAGGPKERYRREAQGVFLWRNACAGGDFSSRYWKFVDRKNGNKTRRQNLAVQRDKLGTVDVISIVKGQQWHDLTSS